MSAIALTSEEFKKTCGYKDAISLSNKNDSIIDSCLNESSVIMKGYYEKSNREGEFDELNDYISYSIMNYAIFLLYQRADIVEVGLTWRKKAFNYLNMVLGSNISSDGTNTSRVERAVSYSNVSNKRSDGLVELIDWF